MPEYPLRFTFTTIFFGPKIVGFIIILQIKNIKDH